VKISQKETTTTICKIDKRYHLGVRREPDLHIPNSIDLYNNPAFQIVYLMSYLKKISYLKDKKTR
jgi:hypothetical protein